MIFYNEIKKTKKIYTSIREVSISTDESELILNFPRTVQCFVPKTKYLDRVKVLRFTPDIRVHKFLLGEYVVKKLRKPHGCSFLLKSNCGSVKETSRDRDIVTLTESLGPQIMRQHNPPCKNSYYFSPKLTPLDTNLQNSSIFAAFYRLSL